MSHLFDTAPFKVGIGVCLFIGGNLTAYAIMQYRYKSQQRASQNLEFAALIKQFKDLRKEIKELNQAVIDEVTELRKEVQQSERRSHAISVWSYKTACSEDEGHELGEVSPVGDIGISEVKKTISFEENKRLFYGKVDELYGGGDEDKEAAMRVLQDNEIHYKEDWEFLWRLGRSHISLHEMRGLVTEKKTHAIASLQYTEEALKLYEASADVHKWYAIALGTMTDYIPTKEKITNGFKLKEHILRALELSPSDATLYFMMGRWCYGVYMLSWVERKLASTLFATPPESTIEDALKYFLKAEEVNSGFYKANQLYVAKCYYEMSQYDEAKRWLVSAKKLNVSNSDDQKTQEEATALLDKL